MRATKSSKSILRFTGLALVFVLAVALVISGVALSPNSGSKLHTENVAHAGSNAPETTSLNMNTVTVGGVTYDMTAPAIPVGEIANIKEYLWSPNTYENFYFFTTGAGNGGGDRDGDNVRYNQWHIAGNNGIGVYAYYKLPNWLATMGANITVTIDSVTISIKNTSNTVAFQSVALCSEVKDGSFYDTATGGSTTNFPATISSGMQYVRVEFSGVCNSNSQVSIDVSKLVLKIKINDIENSQGPYIVAWDGTSAASNVYTNDFNEAHTVYNDSSKYNIIGNNTATGSWDPDQYVALNYEEAEAYDGILYTLTNNVYSPVPTYDYVADANGGFVKEGAQYVDYNPATHSGQQRYLRVRRIVSSNTQYYRKADINEYSSISGLSTIYMTSTPKTNTTYTKKYSFVLYDHLFGIKDATITGFNLLKVYTDGTVTDGSKYTYTRTNKIPEGLQSITVEPFGYLTATKTGNFRGLQVTVVYDGLDLSYDATAYTALSTAAEKTAYLAEHDVQSDQTYIVRLTNKKGVSAKNLVVTMGGLDYTVPALPTSVNYVSKYTLSAAKAPWNVSLPWFDTQDLEYKVVVDKDAHGDVIYTYCLYYKATTPTSIDDYTLVEGKQDVVIENPNFDGIGDAMREEGLADGYYKYVLTATDALGRHYQVTGTTPTGSPVDYGTHIQTAKPTYFVIDRGTNDYTWGVAATYGADNSVYDGRWTNQQVSVAFNAIAGKTIGTYKYWYRYDGETNSTSIDWTEGSYTTAFHIGADPSVPAGFRRTYYFKVVLESGKVFEYSVDVKFDNSATVMPLSTTLMTYASSTNPYTDLLDLTVDILGKDGDTDPVDISTLVGGSPRILNYSITRTGAAARTGTAQIVNGETTLDIFGKVNVSAKTTAEVKLWFTDEAGNTSAPYTANIYIDTAKIYVGFTINDSVKRFYSGDDSVAANLIGYQLYYDAGRKNVISSSLLNATYSTRYADKLAGLDKNVYVSALALNQPSATSIYADIYDKYVLTAYSADGNRNVDFVPGATSAQLVVGKHTIQKARLAIIQKSAFSFVYNGKNVFSVKGCGQDTFVCMDSANSEEWKDIVWAGTLTFGNKYVSRDGDNNVIAKTAQISAIVLTFKTNNSAAGANYQLVNASGSTTLNVYCDATISPKYITMTTNANLSKVYDGTTAVNITADDYELIGIEEGDLVSLNLTKLNQSKFTSANVGDAYTITVKTELTGYDMRNYILVDNLQDKNLLTTKDFTDVSITAKEISVNFGTIAKVFDNNNKITFVQANTTPGNNQYQLVGVVECDKTNVSLDVNATYPDFNVGTYTEMPVSVAVVGVGSENYKLTQSEFTFDGGISQLTVKRITFLGVYVVDNSNNYLYKDTAGAIYQKTADGYSKYDTAGDETTVTEAEMLASPGCAKWIDNTFVKGGVIIVNGQRFDLGSEVKFALKYEKFDGTNYTLVDIADTTLPENRPAITSNFTFNSGNGEYGVRIGNFGTNSNFKLSTNPERVDTSSDSELVLRILDFDDVKFDGYLYSTGDIAKKEGYTVIFDGNEKSVKFIYDEDLGAATGEINYSATPKYAGVYTAKLTFIRAGGIYIVEQDITIEKKATALELNSYDDFNCTYGKDIKSNVQILSDDCKNTLASYEKFGGNGNEVITNILDNVVYQYSIYEDFSTLLDSAPKLKGAGDYYVRAVYAGSDDFIGAISAVRKIVISPVKFYATDITGSEPKEDGGESLIETIEIKDVIDSTLSTNDAVINCFVVVYLQGVPTIDGSVSPASAYYTNVPTKIGYYDFQIVHKDRVDADGKLITPSRDVNLAKVATGKYYGKLTIGKNSVDASGANGIVNGNGVLYTTDSTPSFPTVSEEQGVLRFYAIDQTATNWKGTFNDGLHEKADVIGNYKIATLYNTSLKIAYSTGVEDVVTDYKTLSVNLKTDAAEGAKLFRFDFNADGTYSVTALDYKKNADGTISFNTDKLGWFAIANEYTPAVPTDNTLIIGLSAGGAVVLALAIAIIVIVVKRKRII